MSELKFKIKSKKSLRLLGELHGVAKAFDRLEKTKAEYPGFAMAKAIVEAVLNDARAEWSTQVMRESSRNGVNIHEMKAIYTEFEGNNPIIRCEPFDLADDRGEDTDD